MRIADQGTQSVFVITYAACVAHGLSLGPKKSAFLYMQAGAQITLLPIDNLILLPSAICTEIVGCCSR